MSKQVMAVMAGALTALAGTAAASPMSEYVLFVSGSLMNSSNLYGSAFVGGSVNGGEYVAQTAHANPNKNGLVVGGAISGNVKVMNGWNLVHTPGVPVSQQIKQEVTAHGGQVIEQAGLATLATQMSQELISTSAALASMVSNSTFQKSGNVGTFYATPTLIGGQMVAVFNIADTELNGLSNVRLQRNGADSIIVNIADVENDGVSFNGANFNTSDGWAGYNSADATGAYVLFNLSGVASVTVQRGLYASVLAPEAAMAVQSSIDGAVAAATMNLSAQIHGAGYKGYLPSTVVPTPLAGTVGLAGLGVLAARRRR